MLINGTRYPLPAITETIEDNSIGHPEYGWFEKIYTALNAMAVGIDAGYIWSETTADATPTEMFVNGVAGTRVIIEPSSVTAFDILVTAYAAPPTSKGKTWKIECAAFRDNAGNSSLVDIPVVTIVSQTDLSGSGAGTDLWDIAATVNDPDETLRLTATGEAGTTIIWEARGR
jgi:hypothetical protein